MNAQSCSLTALGRLLPEGFLAALCDPNRLAIVARLATRREPLTVGAIAEGLPVDLSVVSRHLAVLRRAGILASEKQGREVRYAIQGDFIVRTLRGLADAIDACCGAGAGSQLGRSPKGRTR